MVRGSRRFVELLVEAGVLEAAADCAANAGRGEGCAAKAKDQATIKVRTRNLYIRIGLFLVAHSLVWFSGDAFPLYTNLSSFHQKSRPSQDSIWTVGQHARVVTAPPCGI